MNWLLESGLLELGVGLLVIGMVLYQVHRDLSHLIGFFSVSGGKNVMVTFVGRRSARVYYALFIVTGALTAGFLDELSQAPVFLVALASLMIGFMIEALLYRVCIVSEDGLGQVVAYDRIEMAWQDITAFSWNENRLKLQLKSKREMTLRFHDTSVIVELNERLRALVT